MSPIFFLRDPEIYKRIAVKEFDSFTDHKFIIEPHMDSLMGNTLFLMRGSKWRSMRTTLSPAFTGHKMRLMFELIRECAITTCDELLSKNPDENEVELRDFFSRFTNDVIASCAFGLKLNSFSDPCNEFFMTGQKLQLYMNSLPAFLKILLLRAVPNVMKRFDVEFVDGKSRRIFTDLVYQNMQRRRANGIIRPDLIDLLLRAKEKNDSLSDEEMVSQAFVFFLAAFDTVMWMLVAFAYQMAINPEIQRRLTAEIDETSEKLNGEAVTYDALKNMKYMEMVLNEVFRIHAAGVFIDRLCTKKFHLKDEEIDVTFEKGDHIWIPIYCFLHHPQYFPDPEKFDPERFSDENKPNINPTHFTPFGIGPRHCIGLRFAHMEIKVMMFYLLRHFSFEVSTKTQIPIKIESSPFGLSPENGQHLLLKNRRIDKQNTTH